MSDYFRDDSVHMDTNVNEYFFEILKEITAIYLHHSLVRKTITYKLEKKGFSFLSSTNNFLAAIRTSVIFILNLQKSILTEMNHQQC